MSAEALVFNLIFVGLGKAVIVGLTKGMAGVKILTEVCSLVMVISLEVVVAVLRATGERADVVIDVLACTVMGVDELTGVGTKLRAATMAVLELIPMLVWPEDAICFAWEACSCWATAA